MKKMNLLIKSSLLLLVAILCSCNARNGVLTQAFSHNDENQNSPLKLALSLGYNNIEADAYCINDTFFVAHDKVDCSKKKQLLMDMYFYPLFERIVQNDGWIFKNFKEPFCLMIDIKENGDYFYNNMKPFLKEHKDLFCSVENGIFHKRPIMLLFSGSRPTDILLNEPIRYAFLDGTFADLDKGYSNELVPWVSDDYERYILPNGENLSEDTIKERMVSWVKKAHEQGKKIRFWGTPNDVKVMNLQIASRVDIIGTDSLKILQNLLK